MGIRLSVHLTALALAVAAAGCLASSSARPAGAGPSAARALATQVTVRYWIAPTLKSRRAVPVRCPARTRCSVRRLPGVRPHLWGRLVVRRLRCGPAGGDYADPRRACRALRQYARLLRRAHGVCRCPLMLAPAGRASGVLDGRPLHLLVDYCSACGAGPPAAADVGVLLGRRSA